MSKLFSFDEDSDSPLTADVPPYVVLVAAAVPNPDPTLPPSWPAWREEPKLCPVEIFLGSGAAGMSWAKLKVVTGYPLDDDSADVESSVVVGAGDRVAIGFQEQQADGTPYRWLFCGYVTQGNLHVAAKAESEEFKAMGPEWYWGGAALAGAHQVVCGQVRRAGGRDDQYARDPLNVVIGRQDLYQFTDLRAQFNPEGRKNMSAHDATFSAANAKPPAVQARPWEMPDRPRTSQDLALNWDKFNALRTLLAWYNDPAETGIAWDPTQVPASLAAGPPLTHADVDGTGLWEAMKHVCGPEYTFAVDPRPRGDPRAVWGPFRLYFVDRAQDVDGGEALLYLNPLGTPASAAAASVVRVEASKDTAKVCNRVSVYGKRLRHVQLLYRGDQTLAAKSDSARAKLTLQHGWCDADGKIADYAGDNGLPAPDQATEVSESSIELLAPQKQKDWVDKFTTKGAQSVVNRHVFRLFTWNEAGEWANLVGDAAANKPTYGGAAGQVSWWAPDLTGIADGELPAQAGKFCRRRRKFLDTPYYETTLYQWRRVRPTLWICAAPVGNPTAYGKWYRVRDGNFQLDPERGALWVTAEDLSRWAPLNDAYALTAEGDLEATDPTSFATLLYNGRLRMLLECSVETDFALDRTADRTSDGGSPLVRSGVIRAERDYLSTSTYAFELASPSGATSSVMNNAAAAAAYARAARLAGEDQQTHASLLVSGDWRGQGIGKMVNKLYGRQINLTGNGGGNPRGAQVVGVHMDCRHFKWQLLTETAAHMLTKAQRVEVNRHAARRNDGLQRR